jgi:hypothetical protein
MRRIAAVLAILVIAVGCEDRYRYDCQDPDNWDVAECQKPKCIASGYCTEYLVTTDENKSEVD